MNISEANAVNTLLRWVLGTSDYTGPVSGEEARVIAAWLADRANRALHAGLTAERVDAQWSGPMRVRR